MAKLTGESMTVAITKAIRERLERIRHAQGMSFAERLIAIGEDCAGHLKEPSKSREHGELLYDERGLPQ